MKRNRGPLPDDEALLDTFRRKPRCEWCGRAVAACQPHHLYGRGMGGGGRIDHPWNLIALCLDCHAAHHAGHRPVTLDCLAKIAAREKVLQQDILDFLNGLKWRRP